MARPQAVFRSVNDVPELRSERRNSNWARRATYSLTRIAARIIGIVLFRIRCEGRENYPQTGAALVCANHQSYLDPVLVGLTCGRQLNYLARKSLFRFVPFRWLIRWYDAIPIEREGLGIGGLKETLRRLKQGKMVLLFPEGTRTRDGELSPLQPGFCTLARRGRASIVPVAIDGAYQAWPRDRLLPRRATIHIQVGPAISPEDVRRLSDKQLVAELQARLARCHAAARTSRS